MDYPHNNDVTRKLQDAMGGLDFAASRGRVLMGSEATVRGLRPDLVRLKAMGVRG
jgi:hypothetical protein